VGAGADGALRSKGLKRADLIVPLDLDFVWKPYFPRGVVSIIEGDPGLLKSYMTVAIVADLSQGRALPGNEPRSPMTSLIFTAEDSARVTVRKRLVAQGADLERVFVSDQAFPLDANGLKNIIADIQTTGASVVIVDGLMTYIDAAKDIHKASDVSKFMNQLFEIAEKLQVTIVLIRHLKKGKEPNPKHRGMGSMSFFGSIRAGLQVESEADDGEPPCVAVHHKHNLTGKYPSLRYGFQDGRFVWLGFAPDKDSRPKVCKQTTGQRWAEFFERELRDGPRNSHVVKIAAQTQGLSWSNVSKYREGIAETFEDQGQTMWKLVYDDDEPTSTA
jgi:AAA domain-containing protein